MKTQRCFARISLDNLIHNFSVIRSLCPSDCRIMPIIKADGYSHGAVEIAKALSPYTDIFAVAELEEALQLRSAGIDAEILILGYTTPDAALTLSDYSLTQTVMSLEYADALAESLGASRLRVHLKLDTGMHRFGFDSEAPETLEEIRAVTEIPCFDVTGMFTHFCESDDLASDFTRLQLDRFNKTVEELKAMGIEIPNLHCANSAAVLTLPESHMNLVRPGLILYGAYPSRAVKEQYLSLHPDKPLREVMTLSSRIAQIHSVKRGEGIGYSRTHTFERDSVVATVSAGYADGIPRSLSNKGEVTVNSRRYRIVGNVCMDLVMIDITGHEHEVFVGDEVQFWGENSVSVDEYADIADTINYTLYTGVTKRVVKIYE
ncbi:MAG: alanine racemase [Clostridia bacterium]|nr:alanine racemase [Clostridia bacterium]